MQTYFVEGRFGMSTNIKQPKSQIKQIKTIQITNLA